MTADTDPRLQLAPPAPATGAWLFALAFLLPLAIAGVSLATAAAGGRALRPIGDSLPPTAAATLGVVALASGALYWLLARFMRRQALSLSADALELRSSFYHCRTPLARLNLERARVVDLDERVELRPMLKRNGFGLPGFRSGWFLLRNRRRAFVATAGGRRALWLPGTGKHDLLIEPRDPAALLARLRELAAAQDRR